ncbi:MAG: phosphoenolpyruvate protein kinase [Verrucomicrobia bacterium]|nr:MAG: phosphoenolpyruvate protein kinase [Verrucomicrobiota bacterium]
MFTAIQNWVRLAGEPAVVRRAIIMTVIVGSILIGINQAPAIVRGHLTRLRVAQICLTLIVPYMVSTISSVAARNDRR